MLAGAGCASSTHHLTGHARPAIGIEQVRIYTTPPRRYEEIGLVEASSGGSLFGSDAGGTEEAMALIKSEAAKLGANGVLLTSVEDRAGGSIGFGVGGAGFSAGRHHATGVAGDVGVGTPIIKKAATGLAIYVPNQH
jgi:hypothetical protein